MLSRDPLHDPDEPQVRPWPRAMRLIFLLLAGAASWAVVLVLLWVLWERRGV